MPKSILQINTDKLKNKFAINIQKKADQVGKKIVKAASYALFEHIKEEAAKVLHTRKQFYINNLSIKENQAISGYRIVLRKPAVFIELGLPKRQLRDDMLKKGETVRVIPLSDNPLIGINKAKKSQGGPVKFRTMSLNQVSSMWNTSAIEGVQLFKKAKVWFNQQLKQGAFSKKK